MTVFEELGTARAAGLSSEAQASLAASADEVAAVMLFTETLDTFMQILLRSNGDGADGVSLKA